MNKDLITHITSQACWEKAQANNVYLSETYDNDGFIHLSTQSQVFGTLNNFFKNIESVLILYIDPSKLTSELKYEPPVHPHNDDEDENNNANDYQGILFPHLYGPLNLEAVVSTRELNKSKDGTFKDE
eukprot:TRINITY_DN15173_c0_g1_i1.p1 TRINITY_DN15173_c0_g1~~TRINITY_DN15173_c0_g1_i1.p1  ORF type:complete len:128 (-),score=34.77 TRINITY_DN15173_c0_g1_i1:49-432(-)